MNFFLMLLAMLSFNVMPFTKSRPNDNDTEENIVPDDSTQIQAQSPNDTSKEVGSKNDDTTKASSDDESDQNPTSGGSESNSDEPSVTEQPNPFIAGQPDPKSDPGDKDPTSSDGPEPIIPDEPEYTAPTPIDGSPDAIKLASEDTLDVIGARVTTLSAPESDNDAEIVSITILEQPLHGNVTVNPDNSLALVLSHPSAKDYTGILDVTYEVTYDDGTTVVENQTFNVQTPNQLEGWGSGDHYMLQTDENDDLIIEHGDNHREIYISGNDDALSIEDIAAIENLNVNVITGDWLAQSDYGRSEDSPLDDAAGRALWHSITGLGEEPGSHWMFFEKGYEYEVDRLVQEGAEGESELHPLYISSYGEGDTPVLNGFLTIYQKASENIVIEDVAFGANFATIEGGNYILDGVDNNGYVISFQGLGAHTLRHSEITDSHREGPSSGEDWVASPDRIQGLYVDKTTGLLVEDNFFDLNGWELDYDYYGSGDEGQPPSFLNHNMYINKDTSEVTLRDNLILRGSSFGAQVRPGGYIEDNVFAGNNVGFNVLGGENAGDDYATQNYSFVTDNVVTSGGFNITNEKQGATTWGFDASGKESTLLQNIVAHLVAPTTDLDLPDVYDINGQNYLAILNPTDEHIYFNDTIVYNWGIDGANKPAPDENVEGLDTAILDETSLENFTALLLSQETATLADLANFIRENPGIVESDDIIDYFQSGFGIVPDTENRADSETLRFIPSDLAEGVRWDNRLNWNTGDVPGTAMGDSVDLGGNWVVYGGSTTIDNLDFGTGGALKATHGYLEVEGETTAGADGATLDIDSAGQVWINGYSDKDALDVNVAGGRFANTGDIDGDIDLDVSDNGQAILATAGAEFDITNGSSISVTGSDAKIGFDGDNGDIAILKVAEGGRIDMVADEGGFSTIGTFRSGHYDQDDSNVLSGIALDGGTLGIDVSALDTKGHQEILMSADELIGSFDEIEIAGLGDDRDATLIFDYDNDTVELKIGAAGSGSGATEIEDIGDMGEANATEELWAALTDGQGEYDETFNEPVVSEVDELADALD